MYSRKPHHPTITVSAPLRPPKRKSTLVQMVPLLLVLAAIVIGIMMFASFRNHPPVPAPTLVSEPAQK